jgi:hypothetical protein
MNSLQFLAETHVFGIVLHPWKIVGLSGSVVFGLRFLLQWIASERARKSVIPFGFWECDLPARFRWRAKHRDATAHLPAQSLLPLHAQTSEARGQRAATGGMTFDISGLARDLDLAWTA